LTLQETVFRWESSDLSRLRGYQLDRSRHGKTLSDAIGDGVNIAVRLEGIAKPGAICLSEQAYWQVKGRLPIHLSKSVLPPILQMPVGGRTGMLPREIFDRTKSRSQIRIDM
jgi:hypothetical protein